MDDFTNRPTRSDPNLRKLATADLAERLAEEWNGQQLDKDSWIEILDRVTIFFGRNNGYEIAREIERYSFVRPDAALVELLDEGTSIIHDVHEEAVKQWVKFHELKLERTLGDRVLTPWGEGAITELRPETASYVVTPDNDPRFASGGGWVLEAERCQDCSTPEHAEA